MSNQQEVENNQFKVLVKETTEKLKGMTYFKCYGSIEIRKKRIRKQFNS